MLFIIPYSHESLSVKRLPWVTFILIFINVVVYMATLSTAVPEKEVDESFEAFAKYLGEHPYLELPKGTPELIGKQGLDELQEMREKSDTSEIPPQQIQTEQQ